MSKGWSIGLFVVAFILIFMNMLSIIGLDYKVQDAYELIRKYGNVVQGLADTVSDYIDRYSRY